MRDRRSADPQSSTIEVAALWGSVPRSSGLDVTLGRVGIGKTLAGRVELVHFGAHVVDRRDRDLTVAGLATRDDLFECHGRNVPPGRNVSGGGYERLNGDYYGD